MTTPLLVRLLLMTHSYHLLFTIFFFSNDPPTTQIYPLSLHDALPIWPRRPPPPRPRPVDAIPIPFPGPLRNMELSDPRDNISTWPRSEEHTSELQSRENLVCRLLLEKKKKIQNLLP